MEHIKLKLNFDGLFTMTNEARGGGLALMWKNSSNVWIDSFSSYHIDAIIKGGTKEAWRLTGFYGEPETTIQSEGWNMLRMLGSKPKLSWCCFGNFMNYYKWKMKRVVHHELIIPCKLLGMVLIIVGWWI